jgi:hypothetical protein
MAQPRPQASRCATGAPRRSSRNWLGRQHCWTPSGWHPARAACCAMACTARATGLDITGGSPIQPEKGDRRFADPTFTGHPIDYRVMQAYLALCAEGTPR